jgi:hypothetical protein
MLEDDSLLTGGSISSCGGTVGAMADVNYVKCPC